MSVPDPFTLNVPLAYVAEPVRPTAPMSWSSHGAGSPVPPGVGVGVAVATGMGVA